VRECGMAECVGKTHCRDDPISPRHKTSLTSA
jgi:hypothetical protein